MSLSLSSGGICICGICDNSGRVGKKLIKMIYYNLRTTINKYQEDLRLSVFEAGWETKCGCYA